MRPPHRWRHPWAAVAATIILAASCRTAPLDWWAESDESLGARLQAMSIEYALSDGAIVSFDEGIGYCMGLGGATSLTLRSRPRVDRDPLPRPAREYLSGLGIHVLPVWACAPDQDTRERVEATGAPAVVVLVSDVRWQTTRHAAVVVDLQVSSLERGRYGCTLRRAGEAWGVESCNPPRVR